ncbi:hypothetical protein TNCV_1751061 [Trichonephila clavipes]|nr:hypothetical protein TNCV_1751061 [Trichonephila clavipes]
MTRRFCAWQRWTAQSSHEQFSAKDPVCYSSFRVHLYHSTPFAAGGRSARYPLLRLTLTGNQSMEMDNSIERHCVYQRPISALNITKVGFKFGDTVVKSC